MLRLGNILDLRWGDVDFEKNVITISAKRMKTRRRHVVQLTPTLCSYFQGLPCGAPAASVFGVPLKSVRKSFQAAAKRAGFPKLRFHSLRKSGATLLLDAGLTLKAVQEAGGWKTAGVLLKHYAAVSEEQKRKAVKVLDGLGR